MSLVVPRAAVPADAAAVRDLVARAGAKRFNDELSADIDMPGDDSAGFVVADGYAHVMRTTQSGTVDRTWATGYVGNPAVAPALLDAVVDHVARRGGGLLTMWRVAADDLDARTAALAGFHLAREQLQLRARLPLAATPVWPAGTTTRTFEPDRDRDAWLAVNNRAFAGHPEQGGWTDATLQRRLDAPWFEARLVLLAFDADGLAGFNWVKMHPARGAEPEIAEIYVIAVDPARHGNGLGRALAIAGLVPAVHRGVTTAMLYVAADNRAARALYDSLGFATHHCDRAYEREVAPK